MNSHGKNPAAVTLGKRGGSAGRGSAKRRGDAEYYRRLVARRRDRLKSGMRHRHLVHDDFTLAAIDDIIARGRLPAWLALRRAVIANPAICAKVLRICRAHGGDAGAQRFEFWSRYAQDKAAA
jgi:hypothetical protein